MIDVYGGDGRIDWAQVRQAGHSGAICKASESIGETDARLSENLAGMKAAGMVRGAYHFFSVTQNPVLQAQHFLRVLADAGYDFTADLPPALDLEGDVPTGYSPAVIVNRVAAFLKVVEAATQRRCIIYTGKYWANDYLGDSFSGHPLWLAEYNSAAEPSLPDGWQKTGWAIWQYTDKGTVPGVPSVGNTDLNRFAGTEAQLRTWAKTGVFSLEMPLEPGSPGEE